MTEPFKINVELEQGNAVPITITPKNPYGKSADPIELSFNYSDKNFATLQTAARSFEDMKDELDFSEQKQAVQSFTDAAFGKGTFANLYKVTESTQNIMTTLTKILALFGTEMAKRNDDAAVKKYIDDNA